jgi:hypothetical protein
MAIVVTKVELKSVMDASGIAACIKAGAFGGDEVVAVIGKTEGKAAVSDVAASAVGDPAVFVSVDAKHQGPQGGGWPFPRF